MTASDGLHSFYKTDMTQKIAMYLVFWRKDRSCFCGTRHSKRHEIRCDDENNLGSIWWRTMYMLHNTRTHRHTFIEGWINATASYLRLKWNFHDVRQTWTNGLSLNDCLYITRLGSVSARWRRAAANSLPGQVLAAASHFRHLRQRFRTKYLKMQLHFAQRMFSYELWKCFESKQTKKQASQASLASKQRRPTCFSS